MHFTGTVYRNPYWPTWPLLEITQGCTHNQCKFCTMYKEVPFRMSPMEWIEQDLQEIAAMDPNARTIQLLSANPLVLSYDKLAAIFKLIRQYLPKMEYIYLAGRVTDLRNKTVEELKALKELGMREISLGVESGDDWTLDRIHKGYHAEDILEQCHKLEELDMPSLGDVAGFDAQAASAVVDELMAHRVTAAESLKKRLEEERRQQRIHRAGQSHDGDLFLGQESRAEEVADQSCDHGDNGDEHDQGGDGDQSCDLETVGALAFLDLPVHDGGNTTFHHANGGGEGRHEHQQVEDESEERSHRTHEVEHCLQGDEQQSRASRRLNACGEYRWDDRQSSQ